MSVLYERQQEVLRRCLHLRYDSGDSKSMSFFGKSSSWADAEVSFRRHVHSAGNSNEHLRRMVKTASTQLVALYHKRLSAPSGIAWHSRLARG